MQIIIFTGFLGSGKTTIILELARYLANLGRNTAFLVNEAGDVPLDGEVIEQAGYQVKQLFGGCVCCQVMGDFVTALRQISSDIKPDIILIEPSGIADPARIAALLKGQGLGRVKEFCIVDAARLTLLLKAAQRLIETGIKSADLILLNKLDLVHQDQRMGIRELIKARTAAKILPVSGKTGIPDSLWDEVFANERL